MGLLLRLCVLMLSTAALGQTPKGHLVLIGGGKRPAVIIEKFIELAGGKDALILVIPTASELEDTGEFYQNQFQNDYGCKNVIPLKLTKRKHAKNEEILALVKKAGGIFFSGGDQRRIIKVIKDTPLDEAIRAAYMSGAAICGTSAGTACQSELMLTGDGDFERISAKGVKLVAGLGLFPGVILDQHFVARQRQNRLIAAVLDHPQYMGVGVDEATAVWLAPGGEVTVLGDGWVQIYDPSQAAIRKRTSADGKRTHQGVYDMKMHLLQHGDRFDLASRRVTRVER